MVVRSSIQGCDLAVGDGDGDGDGLAGLGNPLQPGIPGFCSSAPSFKGTGV